ncbi:IS110 family transposase [Salicibibacter halophilus]|uniref:IS110 family transposase n=1 Tax=Salicibibacter halophilus TaxID=2502791 RepID=A0A514LJL5_9BACI|nr:IS110 family transposase [Salicibibacter halophilus]
MRPAVGIDVSKGESHIQAFRKQKDVFGRILNIQHTKEGFREFHAFSQKLEREVEQKPVFIMEATGHYHLPMIFFLEEKGYEAIVINPYISSHTRKHSLRRVKTDVADAYHLGQLFYKEEFETYKQRSQQAIKLRQLTRQRDSLTDMHTQIKLQFQATIEKIFPTYPKLFHKFFSKASLQVLESYTTPASVLETPKEQIANDIYEAIKPARDYNWAEGKADHLIELANIAPIQDIEEGLLINLNIQMKLLEQYLMHITTLEKEIKTVTKDMEEYHLLTSIPGVGDITAADIIAEIGSIDRFNNPRKLVAFAGVDPEVYSSGRFTSSSNRISKRGSRQLRRAMYMAAKCGLSGKVNGPLQAFYDKKRAEGKPFKVAVMACANKLLHWIYAMLTKKEYFINE